jgi:hypothetical protein
VVGAMKRKDRSDFPMAPFSFITPDFSLGLSQGQQPRHARIWLVAQALMAHLRYPWLRSAIGPLAQRIGHPKIERVPASTREASCAIGAMKRKDRSDFPMTPGSFITPGFSLGLSQGQQLRHARIWFVAQALMAHLRYLWLRSAIGPLAQRIGQPRIERVPRVDARGIVCGQRHET